MSMHYQSTFLNFFHLQDITSLCDSTQTDKNINTYLYVCNGLSDFYMKNIISNHHNFLHKPLK